MAIHIYIWAVTWAEAGKAAALPSGVVKAKTCESTDQTTYDNWYNSVYVPTDSAANNSTGNRNANTRSGNTAAANAE